MRIIGVNTRRPAACARASVRALYDGRGVRRAVTPRTQTRGSLYTADEFRLILAGEWIYLKLESPCRHTRTYGTSVLARADAPAHIAARRVALKLEAGRFCRYPPDAFSNFGAVYVYSGNDSTRSAI